MVSIIDIITPVMRKKHQGTLQAILSRPSRSDIKWADIESLLVALGAEIQERKGSRVAIVLNDIVAIFHRPHPRKEADKGSVASMRRFLKEAGITA